MHSNQSQSRKWDKEMGKVMSRLEDMANGKKQQEEDEQK